MTLFIESSALLKRYVDEPESTMVMAAMATDDVWVASELAHSEAALALCYVNVTEADAATARRHLDEDWRRFRAVAADRQCLLRAVEIGCSHRVRMLDAIHLAAADLLPRPVTFLTFDRRQAGAARALGFEVAGVD
jgi:predicted nucleic acid-binding protein